MVLYQSTQEVGKICLMGGKAVLFIRVSAQTCIKVSASDSVVTSSSEETNLFYVFLFLFFLFFFVF